MLLVNALLLMKSKSNLVEDVNWILSNSNLR